MKLNVNPLFKLISQGEHQQQDFKYCINDSRKIAKSLVAFANTDGGRLLIGVKDNGKIIGISSDEEFYMVEAAAKIYSRPAVKFYVQQWDDEGKIVLEIIVEKSNEKPHYAMNEDGKWVVYIRRAYENVAANNILIKSWKLEKSKKGLLFTYDEPRVLLIKYLEENKTITISKFCRISQITRIHAEKILSELLFLKCINADFNNNPVTYSLNINFDLESLNK